MAVQIEHTRLDNGMQVVVVPDHRAPVAVHSVWYAVGSMDEPSGSTGISHMLEHMMFKGTERFPPQALDKLVQRNGGMQNAFTSRDMTAYHQTIVVDKLALMMDAEADRMTNLRLQDSLFQPERNVVLEERRLRTDSQPQSRFFEALLRTHYPSHTYGHPVIGWQRDIESYSVTALENWYRTHYAPNNATLLVVGDITLAQLLPLARRHYGGIAAETSVPRRKVPVEPARSTPLRLEQVDADVQVPVFYQLYRTPSWFQGVAGAAPQPRDVLALLLLAEILGGSDAARLYQQLVVKDKLADAASSDYDFVAAAESALEVAVTPKPGITMAKIEAAVAKLVREAATTPPSAAEMARARANILAEAVYSQDDNDTLLWHVGSWLLAGGTPETFSDWQRLLPTITAEEVQQAAKAYLIPAHTTTGMLVQNAAQLGKSAKGPGAVRR